MQKIPRWNSLTSSKGKNFPNKGEEETEREREKRIKRKMAISEKEKAECLGGSVS